MPSLKKLMKTHAASTIVTYHSSKRKAAQGATQKAVTRKRHHRTRPSAAQVNNSFFPQNDIQLLIPFLHSYQPLHSNWLWVRNCCPRRLIQHQLNLHRPILKRRQFWLIQPMLLRLQKMRTLLLQSLMLPRYLLKVLGSYSISPFI